MNYTDDEMAQLDAIATRRATARPAIDLGTPIARPLDGNLPDVFADLLTHVKAMPETLDRAAAAAAPRRFE